MSNASVLRGKRYILWRSAGMYGGGELDTYSVCSSDVCTIVARLGKGTWYLRCLNYHHYT